MRRVVTDVRSNGRSYVVVDDELPDDEATNIWLSYPAKLGGRIEADDVLTRHLLPSGAVKFRHAIIQPLAQHLETMRLNPMPGMRPDGYHTTRSIDFLYILSGEIVLDLDEGSVTLRPGDCVIQQGTGHTWRNLTDSPVHMLGVMVPVP